MADRSEIPAREAHEAYRRLSVGEKWELHEENKKQQIRDDATRSLGENLAEGLAHSEFLLSFAGQLKPAKR